MNLIKEVKARVDIVNVAQFYGINVNKHNKALCCFHREKTPSLSFHKEKQIYKCFSCGKGGDVISLVSELYNINAYEAAKKINQDFGLGLTVEKSSHWEISQYEQDEKLSEAWETWENNTFILLTDYLHLLWKWEKIEDLDDELFIEAMLNKSYIEYIVDTVFIDGNFKSKLDFWKNNKKFIEKIKIRVNFGKENRWKSKK